MRRAVILSQRSQLARPHRLGWVVPAGASSSSSSSSSSRIAQSQSPALSNSNRRTLSTSTASTSAALPSSLSLLSPRRRGYATHSDKATESDRAREGVETDKQASQPQKKEDSSNDKPASSSPFPGLEGFFGGQLGKTGQNAAKKSGNGGPQKLGKDAFPFGLGGADTSEGGKDAETSKLNKSKTGGSGGSGGDGNGFPSGPQGLGPYLVPLGALLLFHLFSGGDSSAREITWQEFRTAFLDKGLVDKLVVVNRSKVRVHLHSNATGVLYPQSPAADGRSSYYFSIGSVEAFERKLDDAQNELSIPSAERVPVAYKDETSISNTLVSFAPTLLIVGLLYYLSRRAGGAAGGGMGGGPGGIFGVGKSKAKMFNVCCPRSPSVRKS